MLIWSLIGLQLTTPEVYVRGDIRRVLAGSVDTRSAELSKHRVGESQTKSLSTLCTYSQVYAVDLLVVVTRSTLEHLHIDRKSATR